MSAPSSPVNANPNPEESAPRRFDGKRSLIPSRKRFDLRSKQYPGHEHVIIQDGAGFHPKESSHQKVPEGIHIVNLPPSGPYLNPIEKLWDLIQRSYLQ